MYTVKQIADLMGMTEHTIRYYTDKGLVPTVQRDKNNIRMFTEECVGWLTAMQCLRACGMSIEALQRYVALCLAGSDTLEERFQIVLDHRKAAEKQLEEAQKRLDYLDYKIAMYQGILNNQQADITNPAVATICPAMK